MTELIKVPSSVELPPGWDALCISYFQKTCFLHHIERYNPCNQRYYILIDDSRLLAGACVCNLKLDIFTFSRIKSPANITIIGIPVSIASPGIVGDETWQAELLERIFREERGIKLCLNVSPRLVTKSGIQYRFMPTIEMHHSFDTWDEYLHALRAPYRRRHALIQRVFQGILRHENDCSSMTEEMYDLYLEIIRRTPNKLEVLSYAFFKNLPPEFRLTWYTFNGRVITWHINLHDEKKLVFFFGGNDYDQNFRFSSYFNNLFGIIKEAIDNGYRSVELGQTAEIPKIRMGGIPSERYMIAYHSYKIVRGLLRIFKGMIEYKRSFPALKVFKKEQ